ncbi:MAG: hypothetical protein ABEJ71_04735 [Halodesulfurarchaeum sp.]
MNRLWITNGSTSVAPVVNPLIAACHEGYVPTDVYVLDNPGIEDVTRSARSLMKTVVTAHGGAEPTIEVEHLEDELDFQGILSYVQSAIDAGLEADAEVAVDVTPGRKVWSIIGFRAGLDADVDHLYYAHVASDEFFGESLPTIPRPAVRLVDFTEVG